MRNEFEKQVREKMEALDVSPSAPVWQHVKKEISGKKERRRFFFWILFAALLTVGGYYLLTNGSGNKRITKLENQPGSQKPPSQHSKSNSLPPHSDIPVTEPAKDAIVDDEKIRAVEKLIQSTMAVAKAMVEDAITSSKPANVAPAPEEKNKPAVTQAETENTKMPDLSKDADSITNAVVKTENIRDSITNQPAEETDTLKTVSPKERQKKLVVSVFGGVGSSKAVSGFGLFNAPAADFSSSPGNNSGGPPVNSLPPAPEKAGISFTAGVNFNKTLNDHFSVAAGLRYTYFSTRVQTGQAINRDTTLYLNSRPVRLENYYLNSSSPSQNYTNQFHFVGLPVTLNYRVSEKFPLNISAGVSLQQLMTTNTLLYDYGLQFYYNDKQAFRKTQVFTSVGLSYSAGSLNIGPYLNYGLSKTLKEANSKKHLFAAGLKAEFFFKK